MLKSYKRNNIFNKVEIELNKEISLHTFLDIKVYNYDNIEFVYFVSDFNYAFPWLSQFNYLTIYFDDGKSAIITSLMHRELLEVLKYFDGIPMKVINRSPCYINLQLDKGAKNIALLRPEITTLISKSKFI